MPGGHAPPPTFYRMQDILLGLLLLTLAVLLFVSAVWEWGTWVVVLLGILFVANVLVWLVAVGEKRRRR